MKAFLHTYRPHAFGATVVAIVGVPAAVASYRHGMAVVERSGDAFMAPWLPLTTDGLLLAALVALWARRVSGRRTGVGPWAAFAVGLVMTIATNLASAMNVAAPVAVAIWPPVCLAIVLELVALVVVPDRGQTRPVEVQITDQATDGPAVDQQERTDDELLTELRKIVEREGKVPGREAIRSELRVGSKRADRLRDQVQSPVRLVQTDETDDTRRRKEA